MGINKAAALIKRDGQRAVSSADLQKAAAAPITRLYKIQHNPAEPLPLMFWRHCQIFHLKNAAAFLRHHAYGQYHTVFAQRVQRAPIEIPLDHVLLLIGQQKKRKIRPLSLFHKLNHFTHAFRRVFTRLSSGVT